jgi:hypothetical protein
MVPGWYGEGDRVVEIHSGTAVWRHAGLPVVPIRWVLLRDPLRRFDPQALLCTDPGQDPLQVVRWFVQRWQVEVTFRAVRDHLGVETQRQWSDRAIARTTPCLLGLFSIVTLLAARLGHRARLRVSAAAWYRKEHPTFSDRRGPPPNLGRAGFAHVPARSQGRETPPGAPPRHRLRALPRRLNGQTRA